MNTIHYQPLHFAARQPYTPTGIDVMLQAPITGSSGGDSVRISGEHTTQPRIQLYAIGNKEFTLDELLQKIKKTPIKNGYRSLNQFRSQWKPKDFNAVNQVLFQLQAQGYVEIIPVTNDSSEIVDNVLNLTDQRQAQLSQLPSDTDQLALQAGSGAARSDIDLDQLVEDYLRERQVETALSETNSDEQNIQTMPPLRLCATLARSQNQPTKALEDKLAVRLKQLRKHAWAVSDAYVGNVLQQLTPLAGQLVSRSLKKEIANITTAKTAGKFRQGPPSCGVWEKFPYRDIYSDDDFSSTFIEKH